jgi:hypothetical protein
MLRFRGEGFSRLSSFNSPSIFTPKKFTYWKDVSLFRKLYNSITRLTSIMSRVALKIEQREFLKGPGEFRCVRPM